MKQSKYDFLIVGAGMFGSICARELTDAGATCLVIEKRKHIGGNCYSEKIENIDVHTYGPHIFHTSSYTVWAYINKFTRFNNFIFTPVANYKGEIYALPFNMWTFSRMWDIRTPQQAKDVIAWQSKHIEEPKNLEEQAIKLVGTDIYEKLIKGYTHKQWMKDPRELPSAIIKRLPVRFTYDNNYFNDTYQGIPVDGYTAIFEKMLQGVDVELNADFIKNKEKYEAMCNRIIYTGAIDEFFDYKHGQLEYKTTQFNHQVQPIENSQGCAVMNYTDIETHHTRVIEHRHFTPERKTQSTVITHEIPTQYVAGKTEPMYPVNDEKNNTIYALYKKEADEMSNRYIMGGRLAEYKYYDMDKVIESALTKVNEIKKQLTYELLFNQSKH
jgi:UDP-galactopyranose mutase